MHNEIKIIVESINSDGKSLEMYSIALRPDQEISESEVSAAQHLEELLKEVTHGRTVKGVR